ncbi:hypothetical protein WG66_016199 [Moniliophthora roreri]|uniref:Uncharacterized protein n=1 Tax=Moniliophthora roreri TaxID=221103 RepID=A0A0W0F2H8_MONRR|nr:hypothetical protein WG66_016199 [Moniliophthora roreri]
MNTSRPAPPQGKETVGAPPGYAFVTRVYNRSLRPVVIFFASISAIYALFASISIDKEQQVPKLATISLVLGILYITICAFEVFGVVAASMQRTPLIRIYTLLSAATTLIVAGSGLLRIVVHFTMKTDIISECTNISKNQDVVYYPFGFWGPSRYTFIDEQDARNWCNRAWNHDSWAEIVAFLILLFLAGLFTTVAFSYYRQVLDPTSPANVTRVPARTEVWATHYNPPYSGPYNGPYNGQPYPYEQGPYYGQPQYGQGPYAPPSGPPPPANRDQDDGKPPGYMGADGAAGAAYAKEKENPFADFDEPAQGSNMNRRD